MLWHYYLRLKRPRMSSIQRPICCGIIICVKASTNVFYTAPYMLWHYYLRLKRPRMPSIQRPICCGIITECLLYSALYAGALLSAFKASTNVFDPVPYMLHGIILRVKSVQDALYRPNVAQRIRFLHQTVEFCFLENLINVHYVYSAAN